MSAGTPWSVKGIDAKARSVAKELARRSGMTLGEWLNQMILEGRDVSAALAAEIESEAEAAGEAAPATTLRSVREAVRHHLGDDDLTESAPRRVSTPEPRVSAARQVFAGTRREAPRENARGEIEQVAQALETLGTRLETSETRSAHAVRGVSQAVEALLGRLDRSEERVAERERVISDQVEEVLTSVERLSRTEEGTAQVMVERLSEAERRVEQQGERLDSISGHLRDGRHRLDQLEAGLRASKAEETIKALEGALGSLANQFYDDRLQVSASTADVRQDMVSLSQRLAQLELRDPDKDAQKLIDQVVSRMAQRLETAEARTSSSIRALEQAFSHLDARLIRAERENAQDVTPAQTAQSLTQLASDLSRRMDEAREEMLSAVETATQERIQNQSSGIEGQLSAIADKMASVEKRSARAIEQMGQDVLRIADTLNRRVQGVEQSSEAHARRLSGEIAQIAQNTQARVEAAATNHGQALERLGGEIARISERLGARIAEAERRAADAVGGLRDKVDETQTSASSDIAERIRASEERTQTMLEEARRKIDARLGQASLQSLQTQVAKDAAKSAAASDMRGNADLPNPFSGFADAVKTNETAPETKPDETASARAVGESIRPRTISVSVSSGPDPVAPAPVAPAAVVLETQTPIPTPAEPARSPFERLEEAVRAQAVAPEREARSSERPNERSGQSMDLTGHLLSGLGGSAFAADEAKSAAAPAMAKPVVTDAFGETPADPFASMHDLDDDIAFDTDIDAASRPDPYARKSDPFADDDHADEAEVAGGDDFVDATDDKLSAEDDEYDADFEEDPFADIDLSRKTAPQARTAQALSAHSEGASPAFGEHRAAPAAPTPKASESFDDIFDRDLDVPMAPHGAPAFSASESERPQPETGGRLSTRDALMSARAAVQASMDGVDDQRGLRFGVGRRPAEGVDQPKPQGGLLSRLIKTSAVSVAAVAVVVTGYYVLAPRLSGDDTSRLSSATSGPVAGGSEEGTTFAANLTELPNNAVGQQARLDDLYFRAETALKARDKAALGMLESVANLGSVEAQYKLGSVYDGKEPGFEADKKQARKWYMKAADNGSAPAMFNLAMMLYNGEGGRADYPQSAALFRKVADRGDKNAQYNLASLYLQGRGVEASTLEAYKWFTIAANNGAEGAEQQIRALSGELTENQRASAESQATRFRPVSGSAVIVAQN